MDYIVQKQGIRLQIPPDSVPKYKQKGDTISVPLPKNRINDRFYVAIGNAGIPGQMNHDNTIHANILGTLSLCLNLTPEGTLNAMQYLTQTLNLINIPFLLKARLDATEYHCWDSALLEISRHHYPQVQPILQSLYPTARSQFQPAIPLFMKPLAPGLGLAEAPADRPFGLDRCQLVAAALVDCWQQDMNSTSEKILVIQQYFEQQGLDWRYPYLDSQSHDRYDFES
jgi:HopA1 effector protein family